MEKDRNLTCLLRGRFLTPLGFMSFCNVIRGRCAQIHKSVATRVTGAHHEVLFEIVAGPTSRRQPSPFLRHRQ